MATKDGWVTQNQARMIAGCTAVMLMFGCLSGSDAWFVGSLVVTILTFAFLVLNDLWRYRR